MIGDCHVVAKERSEYEHRDKNVKKIVDRQSPEDSFFRIVGILSCLRR